RRARGSRALWWIGLTLLLAGAAAVQAADVSLPGVGITMKPSGAREEVATAIKIILVLSMLRHAMGMQETPPNTVLVTLALFLTLFTMMPVFQEVNDNAFQPYMAGKLAPDKA